MAAVYNYVALLLMIACDVRESMGIQSPTEDCDWELRCYSIVMLTAIMHEDDNVQSISKSKSIRHHAGVQRIVIHLERTFYRTARLGITACLRRVSFCEPKTHTLSEPQSFVKYKNIQ